MILYISPESTSASNIDKHVFNYFNNCVLYFIDAKENS